ncbi:MAG: hypothetical protein QOJ60_472 [Actinomycetota bacterium]|nr:hypothetical protein [Actinomycetota bacterium]
MHRRRTTVLAATTATLVAAIALSGCGGGGNGAANGGSSAVRAAAGGSGGGSGTKAEPAQGHLASGQDASGSGFTVASRVVADPRRVEYDGQLTLRVKDLDVALARATAMASAAQGLVTSVQAGDAASSSRTATMTLRVPPARFHQVMNSLSGLGHHVSHAESARDRTGDYVDTASRVKSARRSVHQVRQLLGQATSLGQILQIESELSQRQSDLDSMEAQLEALRDVTDLSTIDVTFLQPAPHHRHHVVAEHKDTLGFLTGLRGGWNVFVTGVLVLLTLLGALLPFAMAVALLAVPVLLVWRTRRRTPAPQAPPVT